MTSYSVERPTRPRVRPGLAHLRPGEATTGQPVTIRTFDRDGNEVETPAVYVRTDGLHLRCQSEDGDTRTRRFRPSQVFPRRVAYREWTVTLRHTDFVPDGEGDGLLPVIVNARTELEARYEALKRIKARFGDRATAHLVFHSARRKG